MLIITDVKTDIYKKESLRRRMCYTTFQVDNLVVPPVSQKLLIPTQTGRQTQTQTQAQFIYIDLDVPQVAQVTEICRLTGKILPAYLAQYTDDYLSRGQAKVRIKGTAYACLFCQKRSQKCLNKLKYRQQINLNIRDRHQQVVSQSYIMFRRQF